MYADKAAVAGPTLNFPIAHHCMVQVADNAIYLIGGKQSGEMSSQVWVVDPTDGFKVKQGPSLREKRYFHSCAVMEDGKTGSKKIVVAGGFGPAESGAVEILDTKTQNNEWARGNPYFDIFYLMLCCANSSGQFWHFKSSKTAV